MHVVAGRHALATAPGGRPRAAAFALGTFDGVHRGHQALVGGAVRLARARGAVAGVLTFDPHPARFLAPQLAPPLIMPLERRLELLAAAGADLVVVEPFDAALASMSADAFVRELLARDLGSTDVVVGHDFGFGKGRAGNVEVLRRLGGEVGIAVTVVEPVTAAGMVCSSTKVRELVLEGHVEGAATLLGRPFEVEGAVIRGDGRGRTLGFATANLATTGELRPRTGIYAAWATRVGADAAATRWRAAVSVGTNPTFGTGREITVEAYLLDFDGDLYGSRLRLEMVRRLRDERTFDGVAALIEQIGADVRATREALP